MQKLKRPGFHTLELYMFITNSRSQRNKKIPEHRFVDIAKYEAGEKFQQKIFNTIVVGAGQSLKFLRQITTNYRAFSKFRYRNLHPLISIIKLQKKQVRKSSFYITTQANVNSSQDLTFILEFEKVVQLKSNQRSLVKVETL